MDGLNYVDFRTYRFELGLPLFDLLFKNRLLVKKEVKLLGVVFHTTAALVRIDWVRLRTRSLQVFVYTRSVHNPVLIPASATLENQIGLGPDIILVLFYCAFVMHSVPSFEKMREPLRRKKSPTALSVPNRSHI